MFVRLLYSLIGLACGLVLGGCSQGGAAKGDESKDPYLLAGRDWVAGGNIPKARRAFERALEVEPRSAMAHYELGLLCEQHERDYVSAIYHYRTAIRLRSDAYPADNARVRIESCKQELVKAELLAPVAQDMVRELESQRKDNRELRKQVEVLQAQLARRPPEPSPGPATPAGASGTPVAARTPRDARRSGTPPSDRAQSSSVAPAPGRAGSATGRVHVVRKGETAYAVARAYGISFSALKAANPGVRLDSVRAGQRLNLPSR